MPDGIKATYRPNTKICKAAGCLTPTWNTLDGKPMCAKHGGSHNG